MTGYYVEFDKKETKNAEDDHHEEQVLNSSDFLNYLPKIERLPSVK